MIILEHSGGALADLSNALNDLEAAESADITELSEYINELKEGLENYKTSVDSTLQDVNDTIDEIQRLLAQKLDVTTFSLYQTEVNAKLADIQVAVEDLTTALAEEQAARASVNTALGQEVANRTSADTALQNSITTETNTRVSEDGKLSTRITNLQNSWNSFKGTSTLTLADIQTNLTSLQGQVTVVNNNLTSHANNKSNPHGVTKAQLGLGNVDNTADADKSVKYAGTSGYANYAGYINDGAYQFTPTNIQQRFATSLRYVGIYEQEITLAAGGTFFQEIPAKWQNGGYIYIINCTGNSLNFICNMERYSMAVKNIGGSTLTTRVQVQIFSVGI